jgi:hypothetical protein
MAGGRFLRENGLHVRSTVVLHSRRTAESRSSREAAVETIRDQIRDGNPKVAELFAYFGLDGLVETLVGTAYWINSLGKGAEWL